MRENPKRKQLHISHSAQPSNIPMENVLDLRSAMAKREIIARQQQDQATLTSRPRRFARFSLLSNRHPKDHEPAPSLEIAATPSSMPESEHTSADAPRENTEWIVLDGQTPLDSAGEADDEPAEKHHEAASEIEHTTHWAMIIKPLIGFTVIASLFLVPAGVRAMLQTAAPLESTVTRAAQDAFAHLQEGGARLEHLDFESATNSFVQARREFAVASEVLGQVHPWVYAVAEMIPGKGKTVASGRHLVTAGDALAQAGEHLTSVLSTVQEHGLAPATLLTARASSFDTAPELQEATITELLVLVHSTLLPTLENIERADDELRRVDRTAIPPEKQDVVAQAQEQLPQVRAIVTSTIDAVDILLELLGHTATQRYLVLFQNNRELRPTRGFIGSLALVEFRDGKVTNLDIPSGGVYDVGGQLTKKLVAPAPLRLVNPHWELQDANWFPHFPTSAQKIQWFYERSNGPSVDGVIAITPAIVEDLLRVSGPIDLQEEFGVTITAENFYNEVQWRAEEKYDVTRESKKIIGVLFERLLDRLEQRLQDPSDLLQLLELLQQGMVHKDILIAMNDPVMQQRLSHRQWSGELLETDRDYLAVIHANIAGGKTDAVIHDTLTHAAVIGADGSVTDTVTLTRVHQGISGDPLEGVDNMDYVRFYVPKGSTLLSSEGFDPQPDQLFLPLDTDAQADADLLAIGGEPSTNEITHVTTNNEFGKLVVGGWLRTSVGASSRVTLRYRLPFRLDVGGLWHHVDRYSLLLQRQPGAGDAIVHHSITLPQDWKLEESYPVPGEKDWTTALDRDQMSGVVISAR